ncbi:MAG: XdhC family protein [Nitrososphaerota archaeon]|nr:XdhC family protein [Nitrososphaerota archaeon]
MKQVDFAKAMGALVGRGEPFAVATVVKTEGASIGKPGFKLIISSTGEVLYGTLGGACPESAVVPYAKKTIRTGLPKTIKVYLESVEDSVGAVLKSQGEDEVHVETNCGGNMELYIEPYLPTQRLVIVGQGGKDDVEDALVGLGKVLDFDVVVIDHSPVLTEQPDQVVRDLDGFAFSDSDSVIVLTKGARDVETLEALSKFKLRYVGLMASAQRAKDNLAQLKKDGVPEAFLSSLRTPVGLDIGAITPTEIALSIIAEVVADRYGKIAVRKMLGRSAGSVRIEESG